MATKHQILDESFDVDEIPKYERAAGERSSAVEKAFREVPAGATRCIRQYEAKESASGAAAGLRKRHPESTIKVGPVGNGLHGVYVQKPAGASSSN